MALGWRDRLGPAADFPFPRRLFALMDVFQGARLTHKRPSFGIEQVQHDGAVVSVREEVLLDLPFGDLLHFAKDEVAEAQPRILLVAPMSGHFSTLLRNTARTLLSDHDVYITDWKNARDVPLSQGAFGFDDYIDSVITFLQEIGPGGHLLAICQPCVPALAAVSLMAEDDDLATPRSMTLMSGPIDPLAAPTVVNELSSEQPLDWFKRHLITTVPMRYAGAGRQVYPGFLQLSAFMAMNLERHGAQHRELYQLLADGNDMEADKIKNFYREYFAVLDMTAEFYLETVDRVFQRALLAKGELMHRDRLVNPASIRNTALLTVEGERDDICAVGQTAAAHRLCSSLPSHLRQHHLQVGAGHYGVFSGSKWEAEVFPKVRDMIRAIT